MGQLNKYTSATDRYSVRHPSNLWLVRGWVFIVLTFMIDMGEVSKGLKHEKPEVWAENWIAQNELNLSVQPHSKNTAKLFVEKWESEPNTFNSDVVSEIHKPVDNNSKSIETELLFEPIEALALFTKPTRPIILNEQTSTPTFKYVNRVGIDYVQMKLQRQIISKKIARRWVIGCGVSTQAISGVVSQPSNQTYAAITNMDNLVADGRGVINNVTTRGVGINIKLGINIGEKMELISGMNYVKFNGTHDAIYESEARKSQTIYTTISYEDDKGNQSVTTITTQVSYTNYFSDTLRSYYQLSSVELPFILKYNLGNRRLSYYVTSGVSAVLGSSYSSSFQSSQFGEGTLNETRLGLDMLNLLVGFGASYRVSSSISFQLSPSFKYGIPLQFGSSFQSDVTSLGLFTGISYYFN